MKTKKIAIIGHFGGEENFLDGQTVKTKILYSELKKKTDYKIYTVDTYYNKKSKLRLFFQLIKSICNCRDIFVLLSCNGMKKFFPLLSFLSNVFKVKIYHDVIGGNLDKYIKTNPKFKGYLNSFFVNWVETENLKKKLEELGIVNVEKLPNFKRLEINKKLILEEARYPLKFCTFSRVVKEKGVEDAINSIEKINFEQGYNCCTLDIYGPIDPMYAEEFNIIMSKTTEAVHYCGCVSYDKSIQTIQKYYALLFPTHWDGEGFPGTIVDAYMAGVPVIATDWNSNKELIENKKTGIIYPNIEEEILSDCINWFINNREKVQEMKYNCVRKAEEYLPDVHIERIVEKINCKN